VRVSFACELRGGVFEEAARVLIGRRRRKENNRRKREMKGTKVPTRLLTHERRQTITVPRTKAY